MELLIVMHKLMHNFDLKWVNKDPNMTISQSLVNVPDQSLKIHPFLPQIHEKIRNEFWWFDEKNQNRKSKIQTGNARNGPQNLRLK